jgi:hypothetical protein
VAPSQLRPGLQRSTIQRDSLTHPDQPMPGRCALAPCVSRSVVEDLHLQAGFPVIEDDVGAGQADILERVGQRLLDE